MNKIYTLGTGPGSKKYILPVVFEKAAECSVLIGGKRNLENFSESNAKKISIEGKYTELARIIKNELDYGNVGILVSGDPGFYSLLSFVLRYFPKEIVEVIPGISSIQYLFAKGAITWQDAELISLHGKEAGDFIEMIRGKNKAAFLTDGENSPSVIAQKLIDAGFLNKKVLVGERLSYDDEKISFLTLEETAKQSFDKLSVMAIYD